MISSEKNEYMRASEEAVLVLMIAAAVDLPMMMGNDHWPTPRAVAHLEEGPHVVDVHDVLEAVLVCHLHRAHRHTQSINRSPWRMSTYRGP